MTYFCPIIYIVVNFSYLFECLFLTFQKGTGDISTVVYSVLFKNS